MLVVMLHVTVQANIKYEEMREKAGEAVPEGIKDLINNHGSDVNAEVCLLVVNHFSAMLIELIIHLRRQHKQQPELLAKEHIRHGIRYMSSADQFWQMHFFVTWPTASSHDLACMQHSSKASSQHYDAAKETGPNADIGKVEGVYEGGRSQNQDTNLLDKTRDSAYDKMGGQNTTGSRAGTNTANQIGGSTGGQTGTNALTGNNQTGTNQVGSTGRTGGVGQGNQGSSY